MEDIKKHLTDESSIDVINNFSFTDSNNKLKLINYEWHGGNDLDYNIFNNEKLEEGIYIGAISYSTFLLEVNGTSIYVKQFDIEDGPFDEDVYLGISLSKDFKNIEWFVYHYGNGMNRDLVDIIGIISVALREEDFVYDSDGMFNYYDGFEKIELNIEIDIDKLKKMWFEYTH